MMQEAWTEKVSSTGPGRTPTSGALAGGRGSYGVGDGGRPDRSEGSDTQESPRATPATAAAGDTGMDLAEAQTRGREKANDHFPARRPRPLAPLRFASGLASRRC